MNIDFLPLYRESNELKENILIRFERILNAGKFLFGENLINLENKLSNIFNNYAVVVGSGTDAITLSLMAMGIGRGNKVAVPAFTAFPTVAAINITGATPIYVDVCCDSPNINPNLLKKIIKEVDAVVAVHLYGKAAQIEYIKEVSGTRPIIEDCAQSFGTTINYKYVGTFGNCGAFSLYPSKNIGVYGDGGFVVTDNKKIADKIRELRFYGQLSIHKLGDDLGINSRMDEFQCAIALEKLDKFDESIQIRTLIKNIYLSKLKKFTISWAEGDVPHIFPICCANRQKLASKLQEYKISTYIHYPFTLPKETKCDGIYKVAEYWSEQELSIPFNTLMTIKEINYTINMVEKLI